MHNYRVHNPHQLNINRHHEGLHFLRDSAKYRHFHLSPQYYCRQLTVSSQSVAYNSIVATGENACILHYRAGNAVLHDGDLCLIDAGCELDSYASDITRTFPVNGKFSSAQKQVYEIVLANTIS